MLADFDTPEISKGNTASLVKILKLYLKDSNINVFHSSIKIVGLLSKAMGENFKQQSISLTPFLLMRFKEKRSNILDDIKLTMDRILEVCSLSELMDGILEVLKDKNPNLDMNTSIFVEKAIRKTYIDDLKVCEKQLIE